MLSRIGFLVVLALVGACRPVTVDNTHVKLLAQGSVQELNEAGSDHSLWLRLYALGVSGDCVPETHARCSHDYSISVSEFDEQPRQAVFALGNFGEIINVEWLQESPESVRLALTIAKYPTALDLPAMRARLEVQVSLGGIEWIHSPDSIAWKPAAETQAEQNSHE